MSARWKIFRLPGDASGHHHHLTRRDQGGRVRTSHEAPSILSRVPSETLSLGALPPLFSRRSSPSMPRHAISDPSQHLSPAVSRPGSRSRSGSRCRRCLPATAGSLTEALVIRRPTEEPANSCPTRSDASYSGAILWFCLTCGAVGCGQWTVEAFHFTSGP